MLAGRVSFGQRRPWESLNPTRCGWRLVSAVDTRPRATVPGGQYGVSASDTTGTIGKHRPWVLGRLLPVSWTTLPERTKQRTDSFVHFPMQYKARSLRNSRRPSATAGEPLKTLVSDSILLCASSSNWGRAATTYTPASRLT